MHRFDSLSQALASHLSRRSAMQGTASGLVGGAAFAALGTSVAHARQATPNATPVASPVPTDTGRVPFLFVQSASSATFTGSAEATYHLTLQEHTGGTVYFSDRPERIFGEAPTQQFLDGLGFPPDNPPNAAIVTSGADGTGDVLVVELRNPAFDATTGDLSYDVTPLENYSSDGLAFAASNQADMTLSSQLGSTSLFIDDCPDGEVDCIAPGGYLAGTFPRAGFCWNWGLACCQLCDYDGMLNACNTSYAEDCNGACTMIIGDAMGCSGN